jgi:hypothetical protein
MSVLKTVLEKQEMGTTIGLDELNILSSCGTKSLLDPLPKESSNTHPLILSPVNIPYKEHVEYVVPRSEIAKTVPTGNSPSSRNMKGINV